MDLDRLRDKVKERQKKLEDELRAKKLAEEKKKNEK